MTKKRIIILGAGMAGLSAAWHLQRRALECLVFEKEGEVGGLCRSKKINGFLFDYSGHLLHFKNRYTFELVKNLLNHNLTRHKRSSWIYAYGKYIPYPFQANLCGLPLKVLKECLLGFIQANNNGDVKNRHNLKFSTWINQTFGKGIARYFMTPYNTKFWTLSPQELTCEWLDGIIPVPTPSQVIKGGERVSRREFGYNARFFYPKKGGINQLPLAMASGIKNINTNSKIEEINLIKKEIRMASGYREKFDYLISTMPLPELPYLIKEMPREIKSLFRKLRWNSIFNLNLGIDRKDSAGRHWVYYPHPDTCFFRVGFPHNFSTFLTPTGKNSMYIEVAYSQEKPINKNKITLQIMKHLEKNGLLSKKDNVYIQDVNDIKYGYPIYDKNYALSRKKILEFLLKMNIISCGRYGSWRYLSMEDVLLDGKRIADTL